MTRISRIVQFRLYQAVRTGKSRNCEQRPHWPHWEPPFFFACIGTMNLCGEIVARASRPQVRQRGRDARATNWRFMESLLSLRARIGTMNPPLTPPRRGTGADEGSLPSWEGSGGGSIHGGIRRFFSAHSEHEPWQWEMQNAQCPMKSVLKSANGPMDQRAIESLRIEHLPFAIERLRELAIVHSMGVTRQQGGVVRFMESPNASIPRIGA